MLRLTPKAEGKKISNFDILIHRQVNIHIDSQQESVPHVEVSLSFEKGDPIDKTRVPLSQLETIDWKALDYRATFIPQVAVARANRYIAADIRSKLDDLPTTEVYRLSHSGMYIINGEPVFCTGNEVIRPSSSGVQRPEIERERMSQRLDFDPDLSEGEAAAEMLNLIGLFPNPGRIILSQVLVALMRQAYEDAGKAPAFCIFLYGRTGTQKTTIASFLTQIYNRSKGIAELTRLNASRASAVELLMDAVDEVKVFDDLFPADSKQSRKSQEDVLFEITRLVGDGTIPARMKGGKVREGRPKCGVLFTGEYLIGKGSDAARLLPVEMTKPDTRALRYFQEQPLIVSAFYRDFIAWFIENYDKTVEYLKEWLDEYRKTDLGVHDRLCETHFFLNTAYSLLLEYCEEKGILTKEDVLGFHSSFVELLNQLVQEQNERVSPSATVSATLGNVLERIKALYRNHQLSIASNKRQFDDAQHDGIVHSGCLCLRPHTLSHFFPSSDINDIARELETEGALTKGKDGLTKKISAIHGKYCYCIPLNRL